MPRHTRLIAVGLLALLLFGTIRVSGLDAHLSLAALKTLLTEHRTEGFIVFTLLFCLGNLAQLPGWIFLAAAVLALGQLAGGIVTYLAAVLSCLIVFVLVRLLGGNALRGIDSEIARRILAHLDRHPIAAVCLLRLLFQTAPPLNYTLALSGIGMRPYVFGTLIGLPLPITLYCVFFDSLAGVLHLR